MWELAKLHKECKSNKKKHHRNNITIESIATVRARNHMKGNNRPRLAWEDQDRSRGSQYIGLRGNLLLCSAGFLSGPGK